MSEASYHELISAWFDGQLTGAEKARAETLIADDPRCAELVQKLNTQRAAFKALPTFKLGRDLTDQVMASYAEQTSVRAASQVRESGLHGTRAALVAIASLAAMLLVTLFVFPQQLTSLETAAKVESVETAPAPVQKQEVAADFAPYGSLNEELAKPVEDSIEMEEAGIAAAGKEDVDANETTIDGVQKKMRSSRKSRADKLADSTANAVVTDDDDVVNRNQLAELAPQMAASRGMGGRGGAGGGAPLTPRSEFDDEGPALGAAAAPNQSLPTAKLATENKSFDTASLTELDADSRGRTALPAASPMAQQSLALGADTQPATEAVSEVWLVNVKESSSVLQIEQVLRDNRIAFDDSNVGRDKLETSQAIYVVATADQMKGAILTMSESALVTSFAVPAMGDGRFETNETGEEQVRDVERRIHSSTASSTSAIAKQLEVNRKLGPSLSLDERFNIVNGSDSERGLALGIAHEKESAAAGNSVAAVASPAIEKIAEKTEEESSNVDGETDPEWYKLAEERRARESAMSEAGSPAQSVDAAKQPQKPSRLERFLLIVQFEDL